MEDDENYAIFVASLLRRLDFEATIAISGTSALREINTSSFDLAVVDCEMPGMSGLDLITHLREHERGEEMFALMLTARTDVETKISALRLGFDDFVVKSSADGELVAKVGAARRLIMRQRRLDNRVRELYGLATRDELTGLFNRRYFFAEAERLLSEGAAVNLVLFDLDDFKRVNDRYGHLAGDRMLRDIGGAFVKCTRHEDLISRYGGDEFVMVAANTTLDEAIALAARLARDLGALRWVFGEETIRIGVTTGVASSLLIEEPTVSKLLNAGDRDLYKNKWVRTHPELDPSLYEYDATRTNQLSEPIEFPAGKNEEKRQTSS